MTYDIKVMGQTYKLFDGQRFYHNNYSTAKGHVIPDYLILQRVQFIPKSSDNGKMAFLTAKYDNHATYTKERSLSEIILTVSNLNPLCKKPEWIFEERKDD